MGRFSDAQLTEIALALEASDSSFLWVVRKGDNEQESWMPTGFEEKMLTNNKGLIVRDWVPQLTILNYSANGSSSTMRSWWRFLDVGVSDGAEVWHISFDVKDTIVKKEKIEASLKMLMNTSTESEEIRSRAKDVKAMIDRAVEKGGSSYNHLTALVEELKCHVFGNLEE
ncbi:putative soyasapogenol B glucuronide galactosyltransferase-like isoform 3 [Capsicum annuum]|nr:putative soyasapogenol B glucuronide galactosyltransferase-like isoform 3 [Capsicum annuum]